jgi:AraC family transcriptional regulator
MLRQYNLLDKVLIDIEKGVKEGIYLNNLAEKYALSEGHLRRLFRFTFKQTLGSYIRSRKLSASLDDLQKKDFNILDIALEYGFEYEQSYRRAFKNEFGITPGEYRKAGRIVKTKPPLLPFDENKFTDSLLRQ